MSVATVACWLAGALLLASCQKRGGPHGGDKVMTEPTIQPTSDGGDTEVDGYLRDALHGGPRHEVARQQATDWLLAHADRAYPVVRAEAAAHPSPSIVTLLARFDRADSTAILVELLGTGASEVRRAAGAALGTARDPAARQALRAALEAAGADTPIGGLEGLRAAGDPAECAAARPLLRHAVAEVRYVAVDVLADLGCLSADELRALAAGDPDADVRELAVRRAGS